MPNPENSCADLEEVFINHIFNHAKETRVKNGKETVRWCGWRCRWGLTAAISGAHTIGSAKLHNSGYEGAWSDEANQGIFNNNYYHALLAHGWGPQKQIGGKDKNNWKRIDVMKPDEP